MAIKKIEVLSAGVDGELLVIVKDLAKRADLKWSLNKPTGHYLLRTSSVFDSFDSKHLSSKNWTSDNSTSKSIHGNTYDAVYRLKANPSVVLYYQK